MAIKGQDLSFFIGLATIVEVAIDRQSLLFYYLANGFKFERFFEKMDEIRNVRNLRPPQAFAAF